MKHRDELPALQFYVGDWRKSPKIQSLDYETRGIWFELLLAMHESPERGKLVFGPGEPMDDPSISVLLGISEAKWKQTRSKLLARHVAYLDEDGALVNHKMLEFEATRRARVEAGRKGGLAKQRSSKPASKREANGGSSVSSSVSVTENLTATRDKSLGASTDVENSTKANGNRSQTSSLGQCLGVIREQRGNVTPREASQVKAMLQAGIDAGDVELALRGLPFLAEKPGVGALWSKEMGTGQFWERAKHAGLLSLENKSPLEAA